MENYPEKIDHFTSFAKQKLNVHASELTHELTDLQAIESKNEAIHLHKQHFETELNGKISELNIDDDVLREPLTMLKNYYIEVFDLSVQLPTERRN